MKQSARTKWLYYGLLSAAVAAPFAGLFSIAPWLHARARADERPSTEVAVSPARVITVHPSVGGIARRTSQPGSAQSYESADLYAKVSGYLLTQEVDIGTRVERGAVLAEIDVPELRTDVQAAKARHDQSLAEVAQANARVASMVADHKAAMARIAQMEADVERSRAELAFAKKQLERIRELSGLNGIEARIVDEKMSQYEAAVAAERSTMSGVTAARQQAAAAAAQIKLAEADLNVTQAKVAVAQSQLDRAQVMLAYTKILSPYDGVVTHRNFHPGAYIRSPDQGGQTPLLTVDRVDKVRVLVRIPEREVPYVEAGDKAVIQFDALPQREFAGAVNRISMSEDPTTRTMIAEIDLENPDNLIRDHMYGRVDIELAESQQGVTIPSTCLVGDVVNGKGQVYTVENNLVVVRDVEIGKDTGIEAEVLQGLSSDDSVIVRPSGSLAPGNTVEESAA